MIEAAITGTRRKLISLNVKGNILRRTSSIVITAFQTPSLTPIYEIRGMVSVYQGSSLPSCLNSFPLWVFRVEASISFTTPEQLSSMVIAALSNPKASAPRLPMSVWTQL